MDIVQRSQIPPHGKEEKEVWLPDGRTKLELSHKPFALFFHWKVLAMTRDGLRIVGRASKTFHNYERASAYFEQLKTKYS